MRFAWCAVLVLGLSGCAETKEADDALASLDEGSRQARAGASLDTGSPLPGPVDVAWDGAIPPGFCAPAGMNSCIGFGLPLTSGQDDSLFVERAPAAWGGTLTLTWDATTPTTQELLLWVAFYESCGSGCYQSNGGGAHVVGGSPLVLELEGLQASAASEGLWISVGQTRATPSPVYAEASIGQAFRMDGRLEPAWPADDG